ncbi:MAG: putative AlkP superfamily pyrophosphatase or phosphodiesterase [Lysobacterales bacterium]
MSGAKRIIQISYNLKFKGIRISKLFLAYLATAIILSACNSGLNPPVQARKAIFIIIDGIPADVIERADTPNIDQISGAAGYTRAFTGGEIGGPSETPTDSAPGYANLITGTWANKHNVYDNEIAAPNYHYWDIFHIAKEHDPSLKTAIFSTWLDNRTKLIGDGLPAAGGHKLDYHFDGFDVDTVRFPQDEMRQYIKAIDLLVAEEAARYVIETGPDLSWVYMQHSDDVAHYYGDGPELLAITSLMDDHVGKIWKAVQKRQLETGEDWLIVVTTDHGREELTGKDHGLQSERERRTWIATNSDKLNSRFWESPAIVDILPSIVMHLELSVPPEISAQLDGQSFID